MIRMLLSGLQWMKGELSDAPFKSTSGIWSVLNVFPLCKCLFLYLSGEMCQSAATEHLLSYDQNYIYWKK